MTIVCPFSPASFYRNNEFEKVEPAIPSAAQTAPTLITPLQYPLTPLIPLKRRSLCKARVCGAKPRQQDQTINNPRGRKPRKHEAKAEAPLSQL